MGGSLSERRQYEASLFHGPDGTAYAGVPVEDHCETLQIRSRAFRTWLSQHYFVQTGKSAAGAALTDAIATLEGQALYEGTEERVHVRVAPTDNGIHLDLGDDTWSVVQITPAGWSVAQQTAVRFRRPPGLLALPRPAAGGTLDELYALANIPEGPDRVLLAGWLLGALRTTAPYLLLVVQGEQGSGKSTTSRIARNLVDPNSACLRSLPREERDLMIAARNSWIMAYDNLSGMPAWASDALCRVATGGALATRQLYTDDDEILLEAQRPVVINGIDDLLERPDLADRSVVLNLPRIERQARRSEREIHSRFEAARPRILGVLCQAASMAMRRMDQVQLAELPRMADVAQWVSAGEQALGFAEGSFVDALASNHERAVQVALEADAVGVGVRTLLAARPAWRGTATALLRQLEVTVHESLRRPRLWPAGPKQVGDRVRRLAPALREVGIEVEFEREGHAGDRVIVLSRATPR